MNEEKRQAADLSRRRFLTKTMHDTGWLPMVIGDACDCRKPEDEPAAWRRINNFFAPVISSDNFVKLLQPGSAAAQG